MHNDCDNCKDYLKGVFPSGDKLPSDADPWCASGGGAEILQISFTIIKLPY